MPIRGIYCCRMSSNIMDSYNLFVMTLRSRALKLPWKCNREKTFSSQISTLHDMWCKITCINFYTARRLYCILFVIWKKLVKFFVQYNTVVVTTIVKDTLGHMEDGKTSFITRRRPINSVFWHIWMTVHGECYVTQM